MFSNMEDSPFVDSIPSFIEGMKEDIAQLFSSQRSQISQTLEEESQQMKKMKSKNNKSHNTTPYQQHNTTQHNTTQHNTTQHNTDADRLVCTFPQTYSGFAESTMLHRGLIGA